MSSITRKQISIVVPLEDWKAIRRAAAERHIPMTELCRRWMEQSLQSCRDSTESLQGHEEQEAETDLPDAP